MCDIFSTLLILMFKMYMWQNGILRLAKHTLVNCAYSDDIENWPSLCSWKTVMHWYAKNTQKTLMNMIIHRLWMLPIWSPIGRRPGKKIQGFFQAFNQGVVISFLTEFFSAQYHHLEGAHSFVALFAANLPYFALLFGNIWFPIHWVGVWLAVEQPWM